MKTKLLLLVLFCGMARLYGAPLVDSTTVCKADFDYYIDTRIMTFAPAAAIQFKDRSIGTVIKWHWTFSNSADSVSTEQNPMHIFNYYLYTGTGTGSNMGPMPPIFVPTVCLQIETTDSCVSRICKPVYFHRDSIIPPPPGCYVYFEAYRNDSVVTIPEMIPYSFKVVAPKSVIKWHWDFGDSSTSSEMNPVHLYPFQNATYRVCVNITTIDSCTNSYCSYIFVGKNDSTVVSQCNASFTFANLNSDQNTWYFQDKSTGNPTAWFWDFGDGAFSNEQSPIHVFRRDSIPDSPGYYPITNGIFKVCLTTLSGNNCKSMFCDYVKTSPTIDSTLMNPCGYLINLVSSNILGSGSCKAKASASLIDSLGNPVSASNFYWSNGSTAQTADNLCPNVPYYVVITSENGCKTAGSFAIMDYTKPYSLYGYWTVSGSGTDYNFNYALPNNTYTCSWVFSDGTIKQGERVSYNFASPESDSVRVIVKDSNGNAVYTETIKLGQNAATGIKEQNTALLKVYPNPVQDELRITLTNEYKGILTIEVYDAVGRILTKEQVNTTGTPELRLNTSELRAGFYILSVSANGNRVGMAKFTK